MPARRDRAVERALDLLGEAARCAKRLKKGSAREDDLHRFRVNVRRLRVHLKIHKEVCRVSRKPRAMLRKAFRLTNGPRDAQIGLKWINDFARQARQRGSDTDALTAEAARRQPREIDPGVWKRFAKLAKVIRGTLKKRCREDPGRRGFRENCDNAAKRAFRKLSRRIARLDGGADAKALHEVRIGAKRLRYILEPIGGNAAGLPSLRSVKKLQTLLGGIHDLAVVDAELKTLRHKKPFLDAQATAAIDQASLQRAELFSRAQREWRKPLWRERSF